MTFVKRAPQAEPRPSRNPPSPAPGTGHAKGPALGDFAARALAAKIGKARSVITGAATVRAEAPLPDGAATAETPRPSRGAGAASPVSPQPGEGSEGRMTAGPAGNISISAAAFASATARVTGSNAAGSAGAAIADGDVPRPGAAGAAGAATTAAPTPQRASEDRAGSAAAALLRLEVEMRRTRSLAELSYFIANETRHLTRAQQVVVLERGRGGGMAVQAVSSITRLDRSSPLLLWFEAVVASLEAAHGLAKAREFEAGAFAGSFEDVRDSYPLRHLVWVPFCDIEGKPFGGMVQARAAPWTEADIAVSRHLAGSYAHSWMAMAKARPRLPLPARISPRAAGLSALALAIAALFPVSMSALAPTEVAARDPFIVTTGVEGVVDAVLVEPNATVKTGQPLVQLADTVLKNKLEIANREVLVAETKYKKAAQLAFVDIRGRHDMALAKAELELRVAERDYARDLLARATVTADRDGIAFFSDKRDLIGRPVAVGEKLMEIADASRTQFNVDLGVADAIVLHEGARVKVFLDSDPLHPIAARLVRADYQARAHDNQQLAFRLVAEASETPRQPLRLGVRGTAQVYSDTVPLGFYLLRRPIAAARQWVGL